MNTKVLIVAASFLSDTKIGSKRWWNISRRLKKMGYDITVICRTAENNEGSLEKKKICYEEKIRLIELPFKEPRNRSSLRTKIKKEVEGNKDFKRKRNSLTGKLVRKNIKYLNTFSNISYNYYREKLDLNVLKEYEKKNGIIEKPDVIICTNPKVIGAYLNERFNDSVYLVDYRDPPFFPAETNLYNKLEYYHTKRIIKHADAIFTVSHGFAERMGSYFKKDDKILEKIQVIYNGFDFNEKYTGHLTSPKDSKLRITYTGDLYSGKRDLSMLFKSINELLVDNSISKNDIVINYAGKDSTIFQEKAKKYLLEDIIKDYGFVTRNSAIQLQENSDILLMLTWNNRGERGVLTGKFMEYLRSLKPVIGLISGDYPNSEAKNLIDNLNVGIACEYLNQESDELKLKEYLEKSVALKKKGEKLFPSYNFADVKEFNYDHIARQVAKVITKYKN